MSRHCVYQLMLPMSLTQNKIKTVFPQKCELNISVMDRHNDMIKSSENGGLPSVDNSVAQKIIIGDTTLRSFIPPQVRKMTPKLFQIRRCELCIIPKDTRINLNRFRTRLITYLHHKSVRGHTRNRLFSTKSALHYKYRVFIYGKC